ncbi:MAG: NfeD family protein [Planctomycetota bacterium]
MQLAAFNLVDPLAIAVMLLLVGLALLVAEVFFPSGGVLGFSSAMALLAAIWFAFQRGVTYAATFTVIEVIGAPVLIYLAFKYLPYTPFGKLLLGEAPSADQVEPKETRHRLVGRVGVARSKMLPAGAVEIDGEVVDAVSQGQPIEPGQYVKVVEVSGNRVMVRCAGEDDRPANPDPGDLLARPLGALGIDGLGIDGLGIDGLGIEAPGPDPPDSDDRR